ncbi:hypothetical protein ACFLS1_03720 [Verrucomicrobiota bacterium]
MLRMVHEMKKDFREEVYKCERSVFRLRDIGMLMGIVNADNLKASVNYYVSKGVLRNVRKGLYVKELYSAEELACRVYSPSYVSLETVLLKAGVIFQFSSAVTAVSYLTRVITVEGKEISYRKIKDSVLVENKGIRREKNVSIAVPERAFLDMLYLSKNYYFDNIRALDRDVVEDLLGIYKCKALEKRVRMVLG